VPALNSDNFINPHIDLNRDHPELTGIVGLSKDVLRSRWSSGTGENILRKWREEAYSRKALENVVGRYYGHLDLRGISIPGENLESVDLSGVDFYSSDISRCNLRAARLTDSWLSESDIRGTIFDWAIMDGVRIDNVEFDNKTSFVGVNLNAVNFNLAALLQDLAIGQQRIAHIQRRHPLMARFLSVSCDYGRSFGRFLFWCLVLILGFGLAYEMIPNTITSNGFWDSLYFSLTVFITLGSDTTVISSLGKTLVAVEATIGYFMAGLLIALWIRKTIND
jgi:hypothetical protein